MIADKLSSHNFCFQLTRFALDMTARNFEDPEFHDRFWKRGDYHKDLAPAESYTISVWQRMVAVREVMVRAEQATAMLGVHPRSKALRESGITRQIWVSYHFSVILANLASLRDTGTLLVNQVLNLGYIEKRCNPEDILQNAHVKGTSVATALRALKDITEKGTPNIGPIHEKRNFDLHRGERTQIGRTFLNDRWDMFLYFTSEPRADSKDDEKQLLRTMKTLVNEGIKDVQRQIREDMEILAQHVVTLFDVLYPAYKKRAISFGGYALVNSFESSEAIRQSASP